MKFSNSMLKVGIFQGFQNDWIYSFLKIFLVVSIITIGIEIKYFYMKLNEIKGLLTYELVERKEGCNIFINGLNEKMAVCKNLIEDEE